MELHTIGIDFTSRADFLARLADHISEKSQTCCRPQPKNRWLKTPSGAA